MPLQPLLHSDYLPVQGLTDVIAQVYRHGRIAEGKYTKGVGQALKFPEVNFFLITSSRILVTAPPTGNQQPVTSNIPDFPVLCTSYFQQVK